MSVRKKTKTILLCTCELDDCGKSWESQGTVIPDRCRHCGRRTWNRESQYPQHMVTVRGVTKRIRTWALDTGISAPTISYRIRAGWTPEEAVTVAPGAKRGAVA